MWRTIPFVGVRAGLLAALLAGAWPGLAAEPTFGDDDFVTVSGPASALVRYAVRCTETALVLAVDIADGRDATLEVGLHAVRTVVAGPEPTRTGTVGPFTRRTFVVARDRLVDTEADWRALRLGLAVAWTGGPLGLDRQRERFRHRDGAPHRGLSRAPQDWLPLDLEEYRAQVADRRQRLTIAFEQPADGKATVVIEDTDGRRVRNLFAGRSFGRGPQTVAWDGLDELGNVVSAGTYRWRAACHPGVRPEYLFSFANDGRPPWRTGSGTDMWGPDHSTLTAAAAAGDWTILGGTVAESGYAMVAVDAAGVKRRHYDAVHGTGLWAVALAADAKWLYAAHDGLAWGQGLDRSKPDWKATVNLTLTRYEVAGGQVQPFAGQERFVTLAGREVGPGSAAHPGETGAGLAGLALLGSRLYVSDRLSGGLLVVDAESAKRLAPVPLPAPGPLATLGPTLVAVSDGAVVCVDPASGAVREWLARGRVNAGGLVAHGGRLFVGDRDRHTVRVFEADGREAPEIGTPGGPYAGTYDPRRLVNPRGLAVAANGWLWVTEDRWNPKRLSAWDPVRGTLQAEKFGPTAYGAPEAGFDPADVSRWLGQGAQWRVDFAARAAVPTAVLFPRPGHLGGYLKETQYGFHRQDGRTFVLGLGGVSTISELRPDGSLRDLAFVASTHRLSFACDWNPPASFVEAFNRAYPGRVGKHADKGPGVLWVDANGDGQCQVTEFDFAPACENFAGAYWGHRLFDLTIRVPARVKGRTVLVTLRPDGFVASGAPRYPRLADACAAGVPIALEGPEVETAVDRFGNLVCNSDPAMACFAPDGRRLWTYPNRWSNVHGSHQAPLPETGVMQGSLFFLGMAPLDDRSDVFVVNGNHGRFFVLTSDGLYLDEMFRDVRMGSAADAYRIGGECFGGCFGRAARDGRYYLQSGHTDYRLFAVHGLGEVRRLAGTVAVTPEQALAAASSQVRRQAEATPADREASLPLLGRPLTVDGREDDWPPGPDLRWSKSGQFPVRVRLATDRERLYLLCHVRDDSPWVNGGRDWTLLFKTGDAVDLQLGTDPAADPTRRGPVPGDLRLLLAPCEGRTRAVLYRHRLPGGAAATTTSVVFTSPWRSERVDSVTELTEATVAVTTGDGEYRVEAAVPLSALGIAPTTARLRGDVGVIYGDAAGTIDTLRSYWSNQATGLVNDVPGEAMLSPNLWGTFHLEGRTP